MNDYDKNKESSYLKYWDVNTFQVGEGQVGQFDPPFIFQEELI